VLVTDFNILRKKQGHIPAPKIKSHQYFLPMA